MDLSCQLVFQVMDKLTALSLKLAGKLFPTHDLRDFVVMIKEFWITPLYRLVIVM